MDIYKWRKSDGIFGPNFSSKVTWEFLRQPSPTVFWSKAIWFKENIPRNSFMAWLALLRKLPTKDRLLRWGLNVTEAVFSAHQVWKLIITSSLSVNIPPLFGCLLHRKSGTIFLQISMLQRLGFYSLILLPVTMPPFS